MGGGGEDAQPRQLTEEVKCEIIPGRAGTEVTAPAEPRRLERRASQGLAYEVLVVTVAAVTRIRKPDGGAAFERASNPTDSILDAQGGSVQVWKTKLTGKSICVSGKSENMTGPWGGKVPKSWGRGADVRGRGRARGTVCARSGRRVGDPAFCLIVQRFLEANQRVCGLGSPRQTPQGKNSHPIAGWTGTKTGSSLPGEGHQGDFPQRQDGPQGGEPSTAEGERLV